MVTTMELEWIVALQRAVHASPMLQAVAVISARYLIFLNIALVAWLFFHKGRLRHFASESAWAFGLAVVITQIVSLLTKRPRPFLASSEIQALIPLPWNASYPSGHTSTSFALACILLYADWRVGVISMLIALLTALGRVAVGVHYPTDILGGLIVGFVAFAMVRAAHEQLYTRRMEKTARAHRHED